MRAQTPNYVVSVKLHLPEAVKTYLEKSFCIANSAYNEALSFGLRRFEAMKGNPVYQGTEERPGSSTDETASCLRPNGIRSV